MVEHGVDNVTQGQKRFVGNRHNIHGESAGAVLNIWDKDNRTSFHHYMGDYQAQTGSRLTTYVKETMDRGKDELIRCCLKVNGLNFHNISLPARSFFAETKFYLASAPLWQGMLSTFQSCKDDPLPYVMGTKQLECPAALAAMHKHICHTGSDRATCRTCKQHGCNCCEMGMCTWAADQKKAHGVNQARKDSKYMSIVCAILSISADYQAQAVVKQKGDLLLEDAATGQPQS
jgi:hypothetical protein